MSKKKYQRKPADQYHCLCGNQAYRWKNGPVCKRCDKLENSKAFNKETSGVNPTHESLWAISPV